MSTPTDWAVAYTIAGMLSVAWFLRHYRRNHPIAAALLFAVWPLAVGAEVLIWAVRRVQQ